MRKDLTTSQDEFVAARAAHVAGHLDTAEKGYRRAIELDARNADAIHLLGVLLAQKGHPQEAESLVRQALVLRDVWAFHDNLARILQDQGRLAEALDAYARAADLNPEHAEALNNAAHLCFLLNRPAQAEIILRRILERWPDQPIALNNLGSALQQQCRPAEAEAAFRKALALAPDYAMAYYNLGNLLKSELRLEEAITAYRHAIRCNPAYPEALNNLGNLYLDLKQFEAAEAAYLEAQRTNPNLSEVATNLGNLYSVWKRYPEAEKHFERALVLSPDSTHIRVLLSYCKRQLCSWNDGGALNKGIRTALAHHTDEVLEPLQLFSEPGVTPQDQLRIGRNKVMKDFGNILALPPMVAICSRQDKARLRIGYLSADFHEHATMHLLLGVLERRNVSRFETYLYSFGPDIDDGYRQRARAACEHFVDVRTMSDRAAAETIKRDNIDILVDLKGYTTDSKLGISAWRPASIMVSWLGYPGTLGHPRLADYLIGDPVVTPQEHSDRYSETLALMPNCYQPTDCERCIGPRPSRREAGLPEQGFIFCSFNQAVKINAETFSVWCRLLHAVPNSVLWLLEHTSTARANLRKEAESRGIHPARILFAPWACQTDHLARIQLADLALDTFPYGSHTTGSDALWAGVPLVSLIGASFASRVSASLLTAAGFPELIAHDWESYFAIAHRLASQPTELKRLKARIAESRHTCALFDTSRFARDLEALYLEIWRYGQTGSDHRPIVLPH